MEALKRVQDRWESRKGPTAKLPQAPYPQSTYQSHRLLKLRERLYQPPLAMEDLRTDRHQHPLGNPDLLHQPEHLQKSYLRPKRGESKLQLENAG
ncbi:UNVERIFIED_CONTAM: hypothetical protein K2H54_054237 [Gekko kuhli]